MLVESVDRFDDILDFVIRQAGEQRQSHQSSRVIFGVWARNAMLADFRAIRRGMQGNVVKRSANILRPQIFNELRPDFPSSRLHKEKVAIVIAMRRRIHDFEGFVLEPVIVQFP